MKFTLQKNARWPIEGKIITNYKNVDVVTDKQISISDSARIAMRCEQITDGVFDTELRLGKNDKTVFQFNTTPFDDTTKSSRGMLLIIEPNLTTIVTDSDTLYKAIPIPQGEPFRVVVKHHGRYTDVEVACTNVGRVVNTTPTTQWVIITVYEGNTLDLIDPQFKPLAEFE